MQEVRRIDLSTFDLSKRSGRKALGGAIVESFQVHGFVRLIGHGVGRNTVQRVYRAMKSYFALPDEVKLRHMSPSGDCQAGYAPKFRESAKDTNKADLKEFFTVGQELSWDHPFFKDGLYVQNLWPTWDRSARDFRTVCLDLYQAAESLAFLILGCISLALVDDEDWLPALVFLGDTKMRLIHCPSLRACRAALPGKDIDGEIRSSAHEDINMISLLPSATKEGLQILPRESDWIPVKTEEGEMVVNVGDMLSRITNDLLPSTTHRVVNPANEDEERDSIPIFIHPRPRVKLIVPPALAGRTGKPLPEPIFARTFLNQRLKAIGNITDPAFDPAGWEHV